MAASTGVTMLDCYTYSGAEIAIFYAHSALTFQGMVQFKVIAGLVHLYGHSFKPSAEFCDVYALSVQYQMIPLTLDQVSSLQQKVFVPPSSSVPLALRPATTEKSLGKVVVDLSDEDSVYIEVALSQTDCMAVNDFIRDASLVDPACVCAIVIFRELRSSMVEMLSRCFPVYCHASSNQSSDAPQKLKNFIITGANSKLLEMPSELELAVSTLADHNGLVLLIMGPANTGKSTLARYIVNLLLNKYDKVGFLDCDMGQSEFSPSGVVSLTTVASPLTGPPCTHQQAPDKAYFIGDNSPTQEPSLYVRSIHSLMKHTTSGQWESLPLIVNTCGWLKDMGCLLIWDLLRLINPSHVIHLTNRSPSLDTTADPNVWFSRDLVPLNDFTYNNSLGWLLPLAGPHQHSHCPDTTPVMDTSKFSSDQFSSEFPSDDETNEITETDTATVTLKKGTVIKKWRTKATRKTLKRLRDKKKHSPAQLTSLNKSMFIKRKYRHHVKLQGRLSRRVQTNKRHTILNTNWHNCGPFQLLTLSTSSHVVHSSKQLRETSLAMYFAQLNSEGSTVIPWPEFLLSAVPYEIKWSNLAVHCLTEEIPHSQVLYALNGMIVGLTRVDPTLIVEHSDKYSTEMMKFLTERVPLAEYLGYGLIRGVNMMEKLFYIVTPEPLERLANVNCLILGKNELPSSVYTCNKKFIDSNSLPYTCGQLPSMAIARPIREHLACN